MSPCSCGQCGQLAPGVAAQRRHPASRSQRLLQQLPRLAPQLQSHAGHARQVVQYRIPRMAELRRFSMRVSHSSFQRLGATGKAQLPAPAPVDALARRQPRVVRASAPRPATAIAGCQVRCAHPAVPAAAARRRSRRPASRCSAGFQRRPRPACSWAGSCAERDQFGRQPPQITPCAATCDKARCLASSRAVSSAITVRPGHARRLEPHPQRQHAPTGTLAQVVEQLQGALRHPGHPAPSALRAARALTGFRATPPWRAHVRAPGPVMRLARGAVLQGMRRLGRQQMGYQHVSNWSA
jgi:hypothetical protein